MWPRHGTRAAAKASLFIGAVANAGDLALLGVRNGAKDRIVRGLACLGRDATDRSNVSPEGGP